MKPRTLEEILKDYQRSDTLSKRDLDTVPTNTRAGFETQIRHAKDQLPRLRVEYLTRILKKATGFFLEGSEDKVKKFTAISVANGAFQVDATEIFEKLADQVQGSIGSRREFSVTQTSLLNHALTELVEKTGYDGKAERVTVNDLRVVSDRRKLVAYIRELVTRTNGAVPSRAYAQASLVDQALKTEFAGKHLVAVVRNASAADRAALASIFTKAVTVNLDDVSLEQIDEKFARDTLVGTQKSKSTSESKDETQSLLSAEPQAQQNPTQPPTQ